MTLRQRFYLWLICFFWPGAVNYMLAQAEEAERRDRAERAELAKIFGKDEQAFARFEIRLLELQFRWDSWCIRARWEKRDMGAACP